MKTMKNLNKLILTYIGLLVIGASFFGQFGPNQQAIAENGNRMIPDEAIRLRILANSDSKEDQDLKRYVRDQVNLEITKWVQELDSIDKARAMIVERIPELEAIVQAALTEKGVQEPFTVEYGKSVAFPTKMYGTYIYPAGNYEAVLITIGDGKGANWWCVLFPPLCFLDFANGDAIKENETTQSTVGKEEKIEVKFFVVEIFEKIFKKL